MQRRDFFRSSGVLAGAAVLGLPMFQPKRVVIDDLYLGITVHDFGTEAGMGAWLREEHRGPLMGQVPISYQRLNNALAFMVYADRDQPFVYWFGYLTPDHELWRLEPERLTDRVWLFDRPKTLECEPVRILLPQDYAGTLSRRAFRP